MSLPLAGAGLSALLLVLAMPGTGGLWPLAPLALLPLLAACRNQTPARAALLGLACGWTAHLALLCWIVIVLGRYGGIPLPLAVLALAALALYMGLYTALLGLAASRVRGPWTALFLPPLALAGLEWLRGRLFTGFPWMDLGHALAFRPALIQGADLGGAGLLSAALLLAGCVLLEVLHPPRRHAMPGRAAALGLAVLLLAALGLYSGLRMREVRRIMARAPVQSVLVVQGNVSQDLKWDPALRRRTVERYLALSRDAGPGDLVIWPETALPFYPQASPLGGLVARAAARRRAWFLVGAPWFEDRNGRRLYYNTALLLDPEGRLAGRYAKNHLVPFGEYVPLGRLLRFLGPLVENAGSFTPGPAPAPLAAGRVRAGCLICYESIFPGMARHQARSGANLLVNLTNDAWYGRSPAPRQSLAMAVLRAVECRRSLARAANTGISALVLPTGEVTARTGLFHEARLQGTLPLLEEDTFFLGPGILCGPLCLLLALALGTGPGVLNFRRDRGTL